ncbi:sulfotransferase family protein [sulfur-oxidizing endosymbiont of Gigantopelta aegis]|uniref:sulfotransferase family protein n=1 Tax=sulfur-oxidizing endosymbiont of Gigantopelta aegis TaxID=2794934 RepID=UPI0018DEC1E6|nr:sulfotransferase [sulfur-oxidizing endosymbiont of Gigantopelta aegis]
MLAHKPVKVCLIGGSGRSGTTIVSKMFAKHPDLTDVPEWRFLIDPDGIIDFLNNSDFWSPYHYDVYIKRLNALLLKTAKSSWYDKLLRYIDEQIFIKTHFKFKVTAAYSGVSVSKISPQFLFHVENLITQLNQFQYKARWIGLERGGTQGMYYHSHFNRDKLIKILRVFLLQVMQDVNARQNKLYYLEKNTWNILWFDKILEILPEARMLYIYRDPRDVVASFINQTWMPSTAEKCALIYRDLFLKWKQIKLNIPSNSFFECSLENLVENTELTTREICNFWGIKYHSQLINIDLSHSHSGRWRNDFSQEDLVKVEAILEEPLIELNYK